MKNLKGYNANKRVSDPHVFIQGEGCFFPTKEMAANNFHKTGNEVGLFFVEKNIDGVKLYKQLCRNVWD